MSYCLLAGGNDAACTGQKGASDWITAARAMMGFKASRLDVGRTGNGSTALICGEGIEHNGGAWHHVSAVGPRRLVMSAARSRSHLLQTNYVHDWRAFEVGDGEKSHSGSTMS